MKGVYADQIAMSLSLLNELGYGWQNRITDEISRCEQAASLVGHLAQDIATAAGDKNGNASAPARSQFYFAVDQPFRQWLRSIDPEEDDMTETTARWQGDRPRHCRAAGSADGAGGWQRRAGRTLG